MYKVLNKLKEHEDSWPFLEPVDEDDAPNYYKVVKTPMSLQRMEEKLDSGKYKTLTEFRQDFQLILANCKQYNGSRNGEFRVNLSSSSSLHTHTHTLQPLVRVDNRESNIQLRFHWILASIVYDYKKLSFDFGKSKKKG